ncbi:PepSY-associated TM helix domain-containing protein [Flexithrix dorotheae]|uniref:PepSY-associated TM helix domain-containing protein n=1 Tax=Flexithrix dorotheae TaxID=70993 RepID=UPI00037127E0|nr:PepSY-associated TM helix domain-containing protein [Flexithrix dorotheae]
MSIKLENLNTKKKVGICRSLLRKKRRNESGLKYIMSVSHLWLGLSSSVVVFIVCLTGSLYAFKGQIENLVNYQLLYVPQVKTNQQPVDLLLSKFEKQYGKATQVFWFPENNRSVLISSFSKENLGHSVYFDPYSGEVLGTKNEHVSKLFDFILELHRFLLIDEIGKTIVGISVLIFVYMLLSGLVLWFPRKMKQLKNGLRIRWNAHFFRLNYDLHKVLGFYAFLLLLFIAITGLYVSFHWVKNTIIVSLGGNSIVISEDNLELKNELSQSFMSILNELESENEPSGKIDSLSVQQVMAICDSVFPLPGEIQLQLPNEVVNTVQITKSNAHNILNISVPDRILLSKKGNIRDVMTFAYLPLHKQFMAVAKPLHTGEIMGLPGIILYFCISLTGCSLPITGFIIWWKKR